MKIVTWNINGIRTFKNDIKKVLDSLDADIICVQETKVTRDLLDERTAIADGYNSYFSFSRGRSGYSGVATYCKDSATPFAAEEGLTGLLNNHDGAVGCYGDHAEFTTDELQLLDNEGRAVITQHRIKCENQIKTVTVVNVYCPRADPEKPERKLFKLQFYKLLECRVEAILEAGSHVIVLGDVNTSHRPIDHCDPSDIDDFEDHPGRRWLNDFLHDDGEGKGSVQNGKFVDTFRHFHPARTNAFTCWCTLTGARQTNYGTRIDYILADCRLAEEQFVAADIMPEVEGSDHCPVWGRLGCSLLPSDRPPLLCTRHLPEFAGRQQKLFRFLAKVDQQQSTKTEPGDALPGSQEADERRENVGTLRAANAFGKKRTLVVESAGPKGKKSKTAKAPAKPQGNLLAFFKPKPTPEAPSAEASLDRRETTPAVDQVTSQNFKKGLATPRDTPSPADTENTDGVRPLSGDKDGDGQKRTKARRPTSESAMGATLGFWKSILRGPPPPPPCKAHGEPCVLRTVRKEGPNMGRQFFVCARPQGHASNLEARCNFFVWVDKGK